MPMNGSRCSRRFRLIALDLRTLPCLRAGFFVLVEGGLDE